MNPSLLWLLAVRNLRAHRVKTAVVGGILTFGTFLAITGSAILGTIKTSMESSITSSVAGHLQVYSSKAKDPLEFWPSGNSGAADVGEIDNVKQVTDLLAHVDNVRDTVPMGESMAIIFGGTEIDRAINGLRAAHSGGDPAAITTYEDHVRAIASTMRSELDLRKAIASDAGKANADLENLNQVLADGFWSGLDSDPEALFQFLDTKIAPLAADGRILWLRTIGVDPQQFEKTFTSFKLVQGQMIPPGETGMLWSRRFYEDQVKTLVARDLDQMKEALDDGKTFKDDTSLREQAARNAKRVQTLLVAMNPAASNQALTELRSALAKPTAELPELLSDVLTVDDSNFKAHYDLFYKSVAPRIRLYEVALGETSTLRTNTKSGYQRSVNAKVWGIFEFTGLESSDLAGSNQIVDLKTFRTMYGKMSDAQRDELKDIRAAAQVEEVSREDAEAALFGDAPAVPTPTAAAAAPPETAAPGAAPDDQLALNVAVLLKDPKKLYETKAAIETAIKDAHLDLQVIDWQQASGVVGQLIMALQAVLLVSMSIIFLVALGIVNNTLVMTTMERTSEIGTMRAIGARRGAVIQLFLAESALVGVAAGLLGTLLAAAFLGWLHAVGIPAVHNVMVFLFGGPRLRPVLEPLNVVFGCVTVLVIAVVSTFYPALLAARVAPVVAMSPKE